MQSYRQSYFTLLAMNFGPIGAMVKGEMPWDDAKVKLFASDLAALGSMDVSRAFPPGSDKGTTRAKPEIWENKDDFGAKLKDMREAVAALQVAAGSGDRKIIAEATAAAGKSCKNCHDEYKAEDYLY
jgi:cytochrome c556